MSRYHSFHDSNKAVGPQSSARQRATARYQAFGYSPIYNDTDIAKQLQGIDLVLVSKSGRHIKLDEKLRFDKDYRDFFIETHSCWPNPDGWIFHDMQCDFIAYHTVSSFYLVNWKKLKHWWHAEGHKLMQQKRQLKVYNDNKTTVGIAVEWNELPAGIADRII